MNNLRQTIKLSLARNFCSSARLTYKFKLSEDLIKEYQKKHEVVQEEKSEPVAEHTAKSPLIMGRVSSERYKDVIRLGIPKHRFNSIINMYIRENDNVYALDETGECQPGDWVLLRRQDQALDDKIEHKVEKIVYKHGNFVDPITGRRSFGLYYDDDYKELEKIKVDV